MHRGAPMSLRFAGAVLALVLGATSYRVVVAQPAPATVTSPKRAVPDYDGRGNPEADAGHWALWIPRGALAPVYVVHEYVLRRPIGFVVATAERDRWLNTLSELFRFGPDRQFMLIPTAVYDFGFRPNAGLRFTADHLFVDGHALTAHAATGGTDWWIASLRDGYRWNAGDTAITTHLDFVRRPDLVFRGLGPNVPAGEGARYGLQRLDAGAGFTDRIGDGHITFAAGIRRMGFRRGACCDPPNLDEAIRTGEIAAPPGYDTSYTVAYQSLAIALDSRAPRPASGTGARIGLSGATGFDPWHDRSWIRYGGELIGAIDFTRGRQRTLQLQLGADFIDPMQGDVVPFTELVSMADHSQMQGFANGWMVGRSTISAELAYTWPVAFMLDGNARLAVGNAFGRRLDGFALDELRLSADVGVTTIGARDSGFELIFGVGTAPLGGGTEIDSVRFAIGSRRGI